MRKFVSFFMVVVLLVGVVALTGCGGGRGGDENLVGTWTWDMDSSFRYVFNADGTGTRGFTGAIESFTWSTRSGDELRINRNNAPAGEIRNERWTYTISGDTLTIDSRQVSGMTFSYIRQ